MKQTNTNVTQTVSSSSERRTLARITGAAGLLTVLAVLGTSLANDYPSSPSGADPGEVVTFFRTLDDTFGAFSSWATSVGLIAMLWFSIGLALLLRRYEGDLPWRSAFLASAGVVSVVTGQIGAWDAAVLRSDDIDPQVARYAFDLGDVSFVNGWVATGAVAICAGLLMLRTGSIPNWLGWWALAAGIGQVLARAVWTEGFALLPGAAYWIWVAVLCVLLLRGRLVVTDQPQVSDRRMP
jgi:hypothetical protein